MATNHQDVELRIRARDSSKSDLKTLIRTLRDLRTAQVEQLDAAKKGSSTLNELEQSYRRLESVGKSLLNQQGLITTWKSQNQALQEARQRTREAQQALEQYNETLLNVERRSKEQTAELRARTREATAAEKAESRLEVQLGKTANKLDSYGISIDRLDQDQRRVREALSRTNEALSKQDSAVDNYENNLRQLHAAEAQRLADGRAAEQQLAENERITRSLAAAERERQQAVHDVEKQRQSTLAQNEARSYVRFWEQALNEREQEEQRLQQRREARAREIADEEALQQRRVTQDYVRFWSQAMDQIEVKERQQASDNAATEKLRQQRVELQKTADEAMAARRGYAQLALSVRDIVPNGRAAADAIRDVLNPTGKALQSIDGLEAQIDSLSASIQKIKGPVADYKGQMQVLANVQKAVGQQAGQIDSWNRQMAAVRGARAEYASARGEVRQLSEQMRQMDAPTAEMNQAMSRAESRLRSASQAMQSQLGTARQLRQELRQAGIDTRGLATAEERLIGVANNARTSVDQLRSAHERYGQQVKTTERNVRSWGDGERTTLSYIQRIKGEVLALATAYVGLQGGITLAATSIDRYKQSQALQQRLLVANKGDTAAMADEMKYLKATADRLAYSWINLGESYSKFAVAARAGGLTQQEARFTFENILTAARAQNMDDDQVKGILYAVEQMVSKGAVQAEELKQQLGDRLPGAIATFAEATGRTIPELTKAMQAGAVSYREVIDFARQMGKDNKDALGVALEGVQAAEGRLQNAMDNFYIRLAEGGFIDQYKDLLNRLAEVLSGPEGQVLADQLGDALEKIGNLLLWCVQNIDTLKSVFSILITIQAVKFFTSTANSIRDVVFNSRDMIKQLREMPALFRSTGSSAASWGSRISTAAMLGSRAIPLIGQALIVWDIGKIMYSQSEEFARACDYVFATFEKLAANIGRVVGAITGSLDDMVNGALKAVTGGSADGLAGMLNSAADALAKIPGQDQEFSIASALRNTAKDLTDTSEGMWKAQQRAWEGGAKKLDDIDAEYQKKLADRHKQTSDEIAGDGNDAYPATTDPGPGVSPEQRKANELEKQLDKLQKKLDKEDVASRRREQKKNLAGRLAIIDEEFAPLRAQAAALEGQARVDAEGRIEKLISERKARERRDYATEQSRSQKSTDNKRIQQAQKVANKLAEIEANLGTAEAKIDPNVPYAKRLEAALAKVRQEYSKIYQEADKLAKLGDKQGAAAAREKLDILQKQSLEQAKFKSDQQELDRLEEVMNARISLRQTLLQTVQQLRDAGLISQQDAVKQTDQVNQKLGEQILKAKEAVATFAEANRGLLDDDAFAALTANLESVEASIKSVTGAYTDLDKTFVDSFANNAMTGIQSAADALGRLVMGADSFGDALRNAGAITATFFAKLLQDIATAILRQMVLNALMSSTSGGVSSAAQAAGGGAKIAGSVSSLASSIFHAGGVVGSGGTTRQVPASYFANAPKFHGGGMPGLDATESAAILKKGEEVLTQDDPRNILNAGKNKGGNSESSQRPMKMVLVDDSRDLASAMATRAGEDVMVQFLKRHKKKVKSILN